MKNTFASLAVAAALLVGLNANAISLRFKFKTFSSGPNIYACNAGILAPRISKKVCYFEGTTNACTPTTCSTTSTTCDTRCICTGDNGGDWLMNYGKASYQDWKDNGDTSITGQVNGKTFSSNSSVSGWSQLLNDNDAFTKRIKDLSFNLGSELYGAQYFVDICYRGPQIEYFEDGVKTNFVLDSQANATDFFQTAPNGGDNNRDGLTIPGTVDGKKYTELAGLTVQSFVSCDLQGSGALQYARNNNGEYNTAVNEAGFTFGSNLLPSNASEGASSFWYTLSPQALGTGNVALLNKTITSDSTKAPRFCRVRYVFTETDYNKSLPNLRKWQRHGAEMCTYTSIEEGLVE